MKIRTLFAILLISVFASSGVLSAEVSEYQRLWEKVNTSLQDPAELALLDVGDDFKPLGESPKRSRAFKSRVRSLMSDASAAWEEPGSGVLLLAGSRPTDADEILTQTRDEFVQQLVVLGKVAARPYERFENSRADAEIFDKQGVLVLKVTAVFDAKGKPRIHHRYSYYFRPDYTVHLILAGPLDDGLRMNRQFKSSREGFERNLSVLFEGGIRFVDA